MAQDRHLSRGQIDFVRSPLCSEFLCLFRHVSPTQSKDKKKKKFPLVHPTLLKILTCVPPKSGTTSSTSFLQLCIGYLSNAIKERERSGVKVESEREHVYRVSYV